MTVDLSSSEDRLSLNIQRAVYILYSFEGQNQGRGPSVWTKEEQPKLTDCLLYSIKSLS